MIAPILGVEAKFYQVNSVEPETNKTQTGRLGYVCIATLFPRYHFA